MTAYATTDLLLADLATPSTPLRPILTRLNGDNSWMISVPRPAADSSGKAYFHILQDLWLGGPITQWPYTSFLLTITRSSPGRFEDPAEIERLIASIERAAGSSGEGIDAIIVSHTNIDHCDRATLERFAKHTPVLVVQDAQTLVEGWGHFETVIALPDLEPDAEAWPGAVGGPAPEWLRVFRVPDRESGMPYLFHGIVVAAGGEALIYMPHGLDAHKAEHAKRVAPEGTTWLAMLHSVDELGTGKNSGRGVKGGLAVAEATEVKYWARTHDGDQLYTGLVSWFLQLKSWTFQEGVEELEKQGKKMGKLPGYFDLENGGALVLV